MIAGFRVGLRMLRATAAASIFLVSLAVIVPGAVFAQMPQSRVTLKTVVIPVEGMACVVCAASVKQAIKSLDGVSRVEMNVTKKSALVTFAPEKISADAIATAINNISGSFQAGTPKEVK